MPFFPLCLPYELLEQIAWYMKPETLYCFYIAIQQMRLLNVSGSEETCNDLDRLIINLCMKPQKYQYFRDDYENHEAILTEFCSLKKVGRLCGFSSAQRRLQEKTLTHPTRYALETRESLLPLYAQLRKITRYRNVPLMEVIRVGYFKILRRVVRRMKPKNSTVFKTCEEMTEIFDTEDMDMIEFMLDDVFESESREPLFGDMNTCIRSVIINKNASDYFQLVMNRAKKFEFTRQRDVWLENIETYCSEGKDVKMFSKLLRKVGALSYKEKNRIFETMPDYALVEIAQKFEQRFGYLDDQGYPDRLENLAWNKSIAGDLPFVKYIETSSYDRDRIEEFEDLKKNIVEAAFLSGRLHILRYMHKKYKLFHERNAVKKYSVDGSIYNGHVECLRYFFRQRRPISEEDTGAIKKCLQKISLESSNAETHRFLHKKFNSIFNEGVLLKLFKKSVHDCNVEVYEFYRDKIDLSSFKQKECTGCFQSIIRKEEDIEEDIMERIQCGETFTRRGISVKMFVQVKLDFERYIPKFRKWWPEIRENLLTTIYDCGAICLVEYWMKELMTQEELDTFFLIFLGRGEEVSNSVLESDSIMEFLCTHATNIDEAMEEASIRQMKIIQTYRDNLQEE